MLQITDLGLATTWVGHFDAPALKQMYPEMADYNLIALFPIGYAAEDATPLPKTQYLQGSGSCCPSPVTVH